MRLFLVRLDGYGSGAKHPQTHNHQLSVMSYPTLLVHIYYIYSCQHLFVEENT